MSADSGDICSLELKETAHARERRRQRGIDKTDLQQAIAYGERSPYYRTKNGDQCWRYVYNDISYIVNGVSNELRTCYAKPLELEKVSLTLEQQTVHEEAKAKIQTNLHSWTSNSVLIVDTSGSMREADVWGARTRLQAVWIAIALDFVAQRIESGDGGPADVISIICLGTPSYILFEEEPCSWILYNKNVDLYQGASIVPYGHGPFLPSIDMAEALLKRNPFASCAISMTFLSDGRPSDKCLSKGMSHEDWYDFIESKIGALAQQFGRRFTFKTVGLGKMEDFELLQGMADIADDFGALAEFCLPSMTSSALGTVFTSVATSLLTTKTELQDCESKQNKLVKAVHRESKKKASLPIKYVAENDFWIYSRDKVVRRVYKEWFEGRYDKHTSYEKAQLQHPEAKFVAFAKGPFGEGAERVAYRFFELASDGRTIVGKPLVAKESRLILEHGASDEGARKRFTRTCCKTQQLARRLANEFNEKMRKTRRIEKRTPNISLLDCSVYEIDDTEMGNLSVLVEDRLNFMKWEKWNLNDGRVAGSEAKSTNHDTYGSARDVDRKMTKIVRFGGVHVLGDGSDDEDTSGDAIVFSPFEVAQAFSHFSYLASGRKRLVCDLQGVYDEARNTMILSDPVIHYWNPVGTNERRRVHGNTDYGRKGMDDFFASHRHHCGHLCRLVNRGFSRAPRKDNKRKVNVSLNETDWNSNRQLRAPTPLGHN